MWEVITVLLFKERNLNSEQYDDMLERCILSRIVRVKESEFGITGLNEKGLVEWMDT